MFLQAATECKTDLNACKLKTEKSSQPMKGAKETGNMSSSDLDLILFEIYHHNNSFQNQLYLISKMYLLLNNCIMLSRFSNVEINKTDLK